MYILKELNRRLAISVLLASMACVANADEHMADGIDWTQSSEDIRVAYIFGLSNMLTEGYLYDKKHFPGQQDTFSQRAAQGFENTSVIESVKQVNAWYKEHPDQLTTPVLRVLWINIAIPHLTKTK